MRILVTGATGFLGSRLTRRMLEAGHQVTILCRPTSSLSRLRGLSIEKFVGDVTDPGSLRAAIENCDWVIHAAANMSYWRGETNQQMNVNVLGTGNVARASREAGVKRLLHVSSVAAVGIPADREPANEQFAFNLESAGLTYHLSKRHAEIEVLREVSLGLNAVIVNPASIQGRSRTIGLMKSVKRSPIVPCFSGGNCIVDVEDVVDGIMAALLHGEKGQRYILGGENLTFRELSQKAANALHLRRSFVSIPRLATGFAAAVLEPWARMRGSTPKVTRMIHYCANRFQYFDSSKARKALGYAPRDVDRILAEILSSAPDFRDPN
ncbi:MAG: NAD-dependent epimerase/dehydratase family protein [Candidatus Acidiferrales bacterium]